METLETLTRGTEYAGGAVYLWFLIAPYTQTVLPRRRSQNRTPNAASNSGTLEAEMWISNRSGCG